MIYLNYWIIKKLFFALMMLGLLLNFATFFHNGFCFSSTLPGTGHLFKARNNVADWKWWLTSLAFFHFPIFEMFVNLNNIIIVYISSLDTCGLWSHLSIYCSWNMPAKNCLDKSLTKQHWKNILCLTYRFLGLALKKSSFSHCVG